MEYLKKGEDSRKNWRAINELEAGRRALASAVGIPTVKGGMPANAASDMHPFKIYQLPWHLRASVSADDWRKFRVRAGRVFENEATGTDGADENPDAETYPTMTDIEVPDLALEYWFWLEVSDAGAVVRHAEDPTVSDPVDNPNPWTTFPTLDGEHIPIGFVDTDTYSTEKRAVVRQLLRTDVISAGGEIEVTLCDPSTGTEETYLIVGRPKPPAA